MSYEDVLKRFEEEQEDEKKRAELNVKPVLEMLRKKGVKQVVIEYDGYSDSGSVEEIKFILENGKTAEDMNKMDVPQSVREALEWYAYTRLPDGWEINEGSFGTITIDTASKKCEVKHVWRGETEEDWEEKL